MESDVYRPFTAPLYLFDPDPDGTLAEQAAAIDMVNHPPHYNDHPSGVECIEITEHMNFCLGNAVKYIWRAGLKFEQVDDLKKARWYINREIYRLGGDDE
jgi:hypothetical protein